ncbi:hypothetical protein KVT40_004240 [Elsinoe batatas]|uniref:Uncharacterized protein n=1 Tax=Elsinoe batatas TaxID=2601811 RepID=A0A8K0PHB3_9PEZI|nr:hypothetical protein KVT40_004240 [Elsinoe batatas]
MDDNVKTELASELNPELILEPGVTVSILDDNDELLKDGSVTPGKLDTKNSSLDQTLLGEEPVVSENSVDKDVAVSSGVLYDIIEIMVALDNAVVVIIWGPEVNEATERDDSRVVSGASVDAAPVDARLVVVKGNSNDVAN